MRKVNVLQAILILEDSSSDLFFIRRVLKKAIPDSALHEFNYAEDALTFLRSADRPNFDLLLVDINMPRMTGFEFADAYFELYPELRGNAPVYIVSSSLNPEDQAYAKAHPAVNGYLEKPVTRESIEEIVANRRPEA